MAKRIGYKVYVRTMVEFTVEGVVRPLSFEWEDGTIYEMSFKVWDLENVLWIKRKRSGKSRTLKENRIYKI